MKIDWARMDWEVRSWTDEEWYEQDRWENKSPEQQAGETAWAWDRWIIASCAERNRGHSWWLDWDEDDGLDLHCRHCPAGVDELYPDGQDLIGGTLPGPYRRTVEIDCGMVAPDAPVTGWHGPVRVEVWTEVHRSYEYPDEYDCGITVEAA